jgi:hypothetical protein
MKYSIGIDPGASGAIVVIDDKNNVLIKPTPKTGKEIDVHQLASFLKEFTENSYCVIEDVHSIFGVGAKSNFQFGRALGLVEGIISTLGIPYSKITPKKWQARMWEGIKPIEINTGKLTKEGNIKYKTDTKKTSLIAAKRIFPNVNFVPTERSKKDHDGSIDAALIAKYCQLNFK